MRRIVLYTLMSLDGAVDHPGRYFTGSRSGEAPEFDSVMNDNERRIIGAQDAVLLGRHMNDEWSRYWPNVDHQPFADFINNVKKYVVTSTPLSNGWHNSEAVAGPIEDLVRELKARPGGDIGVHGSIQLAQSLLEAELVDELQLVVGPAVGLRIPWRQSCTAASARRAGHEPPRPRRRGSCRTSSLVGETANRG